MNIGRQITESVAQGFFPLTHKQLLEHKTEEEAIGLSWLLRLRWGAVGSQIFAFFISYLIFSFALPWDVLIALVLFTAVTNGICSLSPPRISPTFLITSILVVDVMVLTIILLVSGGPNNPFSVFFLVHVALAALLLEARAAWGMVGLTLLAFASLYLLPSHSPAFHGEMPQWSLHLIGMWLAYALAAIFIAHFIGKVSRALRARERQLSEVQQIAVQNERLATLSSFSANAAHELATPLATIGLAARELSHGLQDTSLPQLQSDATLICQEIARCRTILADLSSRAGESIGEMPIRTTPARLVEELHLLLAPHQRLSLSVEFATPETAQQPIVAPQRTLAQILCNLIRNAFEAHEDSDREDVVILRIGAGNKLCFHILDRGSGFATDVQTQLGNPFITTKAQRGGLGLGIYLAHSYAVRTGGHLTFHPRNGGGTEARLCLPVNVVIGIKAEKENV